MSTSPVLRRIQVLAVAGVTAAAVVIGTTATPAAANACPLGYDCQTTWYSDSAKTQAVGGEWTDCYGYTVDWGERGPYMTHSRHRC
ncbi:hypothetical protein LX16_1051 [Stackebrandtia albiflava]|uniref:Peptidase inhibitor family I36 n=1 Tax=Stackebrandtia albiflava TaxID=406432 RepID=A0A562VBV9_9ACTN|nr:DUF6289 family protein [Stackebrandtia albiflava]TWJ15350.1 hypothetical protein LX16_1051 [Stackebrandtia albiflava]